MRGLGITRGCALHCVLLLCASALTLTAAIRYRDGRAVIHQQMKKEKRGCLKELWFDQLLDHFRWENHTRTWKQRYMVCDQYWSKQPDGRGPIFFYGESQMAAVGWYLAQEL